MERDIASTAEHVPPVEVRREMVCSDCLFYVANGDLPHDSTPERDAEIEEGITAMGGLRVCAGDSDKDDEFSWRRCPGCGSRLGGSRHEVVVLSR